MTPAVPTTRKEVDVASALSDPIPAASLQRRGPEFLFPALLLAFGLVFVFVLPPCQTPDELAHFLRAYQVSEGHMVPMLVRQQGGGAVPVSLLQVLEPFRRLPLHPDQQTSLDALAPLWSVPLHPHQRREVPFANSTYYSFVPYVPQAAGIAAARAVGAGPLALFYAGRISQPVVRRRVPLPGHSPHAGAEAGLRPGRPRADDGAAVRLAVARRLDHRRRLPGDGRVPAPRRSAVLRGRSRHPVRSDWPRRLADAVQVPVCRVPAALSRRAGRPFRRAAPLCAGRLRPSRHGCRSGRGDDAAEAVRARRRVDRARRTNEHRRTDRLHHAASAELRMCWRAAARSSAKAGSISWACSAGWIRR